MYIISIITYIYVYDYMVYILGMMMTFHYIHSPVSGKATLCAWYLGTVQPVYDVLNDNGLNVRF